MNALYFGDNLTVLRERVADESVDLVYLDPPFNSQARYNVLFKSPRDDVASAQVGAFLDFWSWETGEAEAAYHEILTTAGGDIATFVKALRSALGESDMMAYLVMMALRLIELRRVLRPTGSLYLHCDPTASHYLKILLDGIFGPDSFSAEIVWRRTTGRSMARRWPRLHDTILHFARSLPDQCFNPAKAPLDPVWLERKYRYVDARGRYMLADLTGAGTRNGETGMVWRGIDPADIGQGRHWRYGPPRLDALDAEGMIHWPERGRYPALKHYLTAESGTVVGDLWVDIHVLGRTARERLGYPTQKPVALLDRIVRASSRPDDVILDPFCGCGTTVEAAEAAGRRWIGIDVSIHAIHVIEDRLREAFGPERVPRAEGIPADYESAARLAATNPFQFQWWANYLVGVHVLKEVRKGADRGIDGELFFPNGPGRPYGRLLTSVKAGRNVTPAMVRELRGVLERERAEMGLFVCLDRPTRAMQQEAVVAGFAPVVHGRVPRLQILSIADWFEGYRPALPPRDALPYAAFSRPAARPSRPRATDGQAELPLSFRGGKDADGTVTHLNPMLVRRGAATEEPELRLAAP